MEKNKKRLFEYGWLLIVLAGLDVLNVVFNMISSWLGNEISKLEFESELVRIVFIAVLAVTLVAYILSFVIQFYLGTKAIRVSKQPNGDKFHISLAKFVAVVNVVLSVFMIINLFSSKELLADILTTFICVIDAVIMFSYVSIAKKVRKEYLAAEPKAE